MSVFVASLVSVTTRALELGLPQLKVLLLLVRFWVPVIPAASGLDGVSTVPCLWLPCVPKLPDAVGVMPMSS